MLEEFTSRNDDIFFLPLVKNQKQKKELLSAALWAQKVAMYFHILGLTTKKGGDDPLV
jgi:hypothetical protein